MSHASLIERITRSLAYMLRHKPEEFDLKLDREGYADLNEVVQALNERLGEPIEEDDVREAIDTGDRQRYEIRDEEIRALYGHSIDVDPGSPSKPPELLYVGLGSRDADRAARYGLNGGRRRFLHLALNEDDALEMGRRLAREYVVITVHALDAWEEDIDFYDRKSIYLSGPIPKEFLSIGELHDDGEDPRERMDSSRRRGRPERGGRPDRGGRPERGGRGRSGGRGRRDERGGDRDGGRRDERRDERPRPVEGGRDDRRGDRDRDREEPRRSRPVPERSERPARPERSERPERAPDRAPERPERPERAPRREEERRPEPARAGAPSDAGSSFGKGIFEAPKEKPAPRRERPAPPREEPAPRREDPPPPKQDSGPGFGAGL